MGIVLSGCSNHDDTKSAAATAASNTSPADLSAQTKVEKVYPFRGAGVLRLTFPKTWIDSVKPVPEGRELVNVIRFMPFGMGDFEVSIEVRNLGEPMTKAYDIKATLIQVGNLELTNCVEKSLDIHDFKGPEATGSYYTVTDKRWVEVQPGPGEYKYLTQGYAKLAGTVLKFRVVSNQPPGEETNEALAMIKGARFTRR